jgi:hypothetical protein
MVKGARMSYWVCMFESESKYVFNEMSKESNLPCGEKYCIRSEEQMEIITENALVGREFILHFDERGNISKHNFFKFNKDSVLVLGFLNGVIREINL